VSVKVSLNEGEAAIATIASVMRYCVNRAAGVKDKKGGPQSNYYTDLHGFGAELAFGKHRNLYPDLGTSPRSGGSDFINANGEEIDIKCTQYKTGKLIVNEKKKKSSTKYFVLMIGEVPDFEIIGYATSDEIFKDENKKELYGRTVYQLEQCQLHSMQE